MISIFLMRVSSRSFRTELFILRLLKIETAFDAFFLLKVLILFYLYLYYFIATEYRLGYLLHLFT